MAFRRILSRRGRRSILRSFRSYFLGRRSHRWLYGSRLFIRLRIEMILRLQESIGRMVRHREARLWVDDDACHRIEELIGLAKHAIIIRMFIWKDDVFGRHIAALLADAADRGVQVEVTKDASGDIFELDRDFAATKKTNRGPWKRFWNHPNIRVSLVHDRDHGKVYVFDDETLLLGGMNIGDEYRGPWHDFLVELRGQRFVEQYLTGQLAGAHDPSARIVMNTPQHKGIRPVLMDLLRSARHSIVLEQAYFQDTAVLELLLEKSAKGVAVTVILPQRPDLHHHANLRSIHQLLERGAGTEIRIFLYPRMLHGKLILVDRERAFIGSANMMTSSLDKMGEVNVLCTGRNTSILRRVREIVREDLLASTPLLTPPPLHRLARWMAWLGL